MISLKSQITRKLLNYFFLNSQETLYVNELERKLEVDKRNLTKKIRELEREGILTYQKRGNLKLYSINKNYPLYHEYRKIIMKTVGFEENLKRALKGAKDIKEAYLYGSYAKDTMHANSDIDLLVIGDEDTITLHKRLNMLQKEIGRELNLVNMDEAEFKKRLKAKEPFIRGILKQKHIKII